MSARSPGSAAAAELAHALRRGFPIRDDEFDRLLPPWARQLSRQFWTPVRVAQRAARLLAAGGRQGLVLDVGAGVGKFCVVGALTTTLTFIGIEHRPALVDAAEMLVQKLGVERVHILHGTLEDVVWEQFEGFYLFNPFEESSHPEAAIDDAVVLSEERRARDVALVEQALARAKSGTRVVTYHGFGGRFPPDFHLIRRMPAGSDLLRCWMCTRSGRGV